MERVAKIRHPFFLVSNEEQDDYDFVFSEGTTYIIGSTPCRLAKN